MPNLILCFSEIPKIFACLRVRQGAFLSEDRNLCPSKAVPSLQFFALERQKHIAYVKGKHIENRRDQTSLSFPTRSPL